MKLDELRDPSDRLVPGSLVYWNLDGGSPQQWIGPMLVIDQEPVRSENGSRFSLWDPQTDEKFYAWSYELAHIDEVDSLDIIEM